MCIYNPPSGGNGIVDNFGDFIKHEDVFYLKFDDGRVINASEASNYSLMLRKESKSR